MKFLKTTDDTARTINSFFKPAGPSSQSMDNQQTLTSKPRTNPVTTKNQIKCPTTDSNVSPSDIHLNNLLQDFISRIKLSDPEHTWLTGYCVRYDREWLLRFLIVDKYRIDAAFARYQSYYTTVSKLPRLTNIIEGDYGWLLQLSQHINETKVFAFYGFDARNRAVLGLQCKNLDPKLITQIYGVVYDCLAFFEYFYSTFKQTRRNGIVWVVDTDGFNYEHFKLVAFNREFQKLHAKLWCGTVPLTISKVWVCNESKLINSAWTIFRKLLSKKLVDRVEMAGSKFENIIDDLGGSSFTPDFIDGGMKRPETDLDPSSLILHLLNALPKKFSSE